MQPIDLIGLLGKPVYVRYVRPYLSSDEEWEAIGYFVKGTRYGMCLEFHPSGMKLTKHYLPPYLTIPFEDLREVQRLSFPEEEARV